MRHLQAVADAIDRAIDRLGRILSWLVAATVIICAVVAVLRYALGLGWVWMQDAYLWTNATLFMMGAAPTLLYERHVRVDFIYGARSLRYRAMVDLLGSIFLLMPSLVVIFTLSLPYVRDSWERLEGALDVGGMPGVFVIKSVLLLFCIPLAAQGVSLSLRSIIRLRTGVADGAHDA